MSVHLLILMLIMLVAPSFALAYGGPGSLLSGIGSFLAVIAALFTALLGFIWYPLKRLFFGKEEEIERDSEE